MLPSKLLAAAAERVEALAANDLTPGRWHVRVTPSDVEGEDDTVWVSCEHGSTVAVVGEAYTSAPRDAAWIAVMGPHIIGPALAGWLRQSAEEVASMWQYLEPGSTRFVLYTDETGTHDGQVSTTTWTAQSRLDALQARWGRALTIAEEIMRTDTAECDTCGDRSDSELGLPCGRLIGPPGHDDDHPDATPCAGTYGPAADRATFAVADPASTNPHNVD